VLVSVILWLALDAAARLVLWIRAMALHTMKMHADPNHPISDEFEHSQLLPGAALAFWQGWGDGWALEPLIGLVVLIGVSLIAAWWRFERMDIL